MQQSSKPQLVQGIRYRLRVTSASPTAEKSFQGASGVLYNHRVWFVDEDGIQYECEYVSKQQRQDIFHPEEFACIIVSRVGKICPEIMPVDGCNQTVEKMVDLKSVPSIGGEVFTIATMATSNMMSGYLANLALGRNESNQESVEKAMDIFSMLAVEIENHLLLKYTEKMLS